MASKAFYMVYVKLAEPYGYDDLKNKMDISKDWYRITEELWILCTTSGADKWYLRLAPLVKEGGNVFISRLDISDRQGWMNKSFWKWIRKNGAVAQS